MLSRRDVMAKLAAGTAAACVVGAAGTSLASARNDQPAPLGSERDSGALNPPLPKEPTADQFHAVPIVDAGPPETQNSTPRWELLSPLTMGSTVAPGWRVAGLTGVVAGSCVLTLENERGRTHRIHLCRNDGCPQGLAYTKRIDLVVMNGGLGDLPTEEGFARAVVGVAHVVAGNEGRRELETMMTVLLPHAERVERFADAARLR
jgi:hypothetical protein